MAALSNIVPLQVAPTSPHRDHSGAARRFGGFARTLDADWSEIGVGRRQAAHEGRRWRDHAPANDSDVPTDRLASGFAAQLIAQGMGAGAHLENFGGVAQAYQRAETTPYAPQRGAALSLTI